MCMPRWLHQREPRQDARGEFTCSCVPALQRRAACVVRGSSKSFPSEQSLSFPLCHLKSMYWIAGSVCRPCRVPISASQTWKDVIPNAADVRIRPQFRKWQPRLCSAMTARTICREVNSLLEINLAADEDARIALPTEKLPPPPSCALHVRNLWNGAPFQLGTKIVRIVFASAAPSRPLQVLPMLLPLL